MAHETNTGKIYATFTIDKDVKKRFYLACSTLEMNMSEVVQAMMENFIDISKTMKEKEMERLAEERKVASGLEVVESTRLKFE